MYRFTNIQWWIHKLSGQGEALLFLFAEWNLFFREENKTCTTNSNSPSYVRETILPKCARASTDGQTDRVIQVYPLTSRIQRGGGGDRGSGPPLRFVRGGVLCRGLMGGRGGPTFFFTLFLSIFSARFARKTNILLVYTYYKLNVQYGTVILSLYSPYPNYDKNPTFNPVLLGIFILFLSRITRFYTI